MFDRVLKYASGSSKTFRATVKLHENILPALHVQGGFFKYNNYLIQKTTVLLA